VSANGVAEFTTMTPAKLSSGGGDDVAHSRVEPSHGSLPATEPLVKLFNDNPMNAIEANNMTTNPAHVNAFHKSCGPLYEKPFTKLAG
jgi:hypothetical protein